MCQFSIKHKTVLKYIQKIHYVFHKFDKKQFLKCCRVCGRRLKTAKGVGRSFTCSSNSNSSWKHFQLEYDTDTHPTEYCFACQGMIRRKISADKKDFPYSTHSTHTTCTSGIDIGREKVRLKKKNCTLKCMLVNNTVVCDHFKSIVAGGRKNGKKEKVDPVE